MGKSLGNFIDLEKLRGLIQTYSLDNLRYYLLRAAPFGSDLDWTDTDFEKSVNELANVVGNCLNRVVKMVGLYRGGTIPAQAPRALPELDASLVARADALEAQVDQAYRKFDLQHAVTLPVELARAANGYIDATAPFKLAKDPAQAGRLDTVLNVAARSIYRALVGLLPVLPEKAAAGLLQLGVDSAAKTLSELRELAPVAGSVLREGVPLFPKVEAKK
jgi:methionyl-tRNA synthetase